LSIHFSLQWERLDFVALVFVAPALLPVMKQNFVFVASLLGDDETLVFVAPALLPVMKQSFVFVASPLGDDETLVFVAPALLPVKKARLQSA
jgi:hypothetical protein